MYDRLTKLDVEKMEKELEHRKLVVRKEALEDVKEARAQGDLSENFEYKAAKKVKNRNESRIRYLERMIKTAQIVEDDAGEEELWDISLWLWFADLMGSQTFFIPGGRVSLSF